MLGISEAIPRVLDHLEPASAQRFLPGIKRHLAALGIHGLAEQLRWEAYLSLALLEDNDAFDAPRAAAPGGCDGVHPSSDRQCVLLSLLDIWGNHDTNQTIRYLIAFIVDSSSASKIRLQAPRALCQQGHSSGPLSLRRHK